MKILFMNLAFMLCCMVVTTQNMLSSSSCLKLIPTDSSARYYNPDSVFADTCSEFNSYYSTGPFVIDFQTDIAYFLDHIPQINGEIFISNVLPSETSLIHSLQQLDSVGHYRMYRKMPNVSDSDYVHLVTISFVFDSAVNINDIQKVFSSFEHLSALHCPRIPVFLTNIPNDAALDPRYIGNDIGYNLGHTRDPLGPEHHLFSIGSPMAWALTKGKSAITVCVDDGITPVPEYIGNVLNTDYLLRQSGHEELFSNHKRFDYSQVETNGAGNSPHPGLQEGHTMECESMVNCEENTGLQASELPIIGVAPLVSSCYMTIHTNSYLGEPILDIDGARNGKHKYPDVYTYSACAGYFRGWDPNTRSTEIRKFIDRGMLSVVSIGNSVFGEHNFLWQPCEDDIKYGSFFTVYPTLSWPACEVWPEPGHENDPTHDYRAIAVGMCGTGGYKYNEDCSVTWYNTCEYNGFFMHHGDEKAIDKAPYSPLADKDNINSDPYLRQIAKAHAYVDLVAPGTEIIVADEPTKYVMDVSGSSLSAPIVGAVLAQMRSIDLYLGCKSQLNYNAEGNVTNGWLLQRRAYDIATFTATKIHDYTNNAVHSDFVPEEYQCDAENYQFGIDPTAKDNKDHDKPSCDLWTYATDHNIDGSVLFLDYKLLLHDPLKRYWAQRVGFGKINAYRAVAQSIPVKGKYSYQPTSEIYDLNDQFNDEEHNNLDDNGTPQPCLNEGNLRLMHWGSLVSENDIEANSYPDRNSNGFVGDILHVLEYGGASRIGEHYNNYGVTKLHGNGNSGCKYTLPPNCILASDGIVIGAPAVIDGTENIRVSAENQNSMVLLEGYLYNVEVLGCMKLSDLIIAGNEHAALLHVNSEIASEFYKNTAISGGAQLLIDNGLAKVMTGGSIFNYGQSDIIVENNGVLRMQPNSEIHSTTGVLRVKSSGTLIVENAAHTILDCDIVVESGGKVEILEDGVVTARHITTEYGSAFIVRRGAWLELSNSSVTNSFGGAITLDGSADKRVTISAHRTGISEGCCALNCNDIAIYDEDMQVLRGSHASVVINDVIPQNDNTQSVSWTYANIYNTNTTVNRSNISNMSNCYFSSLMLNNDDGVGYVLLTLTDCEGVQISGCRFVDSTAISSQYSVRRAGIFANRTDNITVNNCSFARLDVALSMSAVNNYNVSDNDVYRCKIGFNEMICSDPQ